jgi:NADH:ubiquinone oxidoreductase subunit C
VAGNVLARQDRALSPDEQVALLRDRLGDDAVLDVTDAYGTVTVTVAPDRWLDVVERCRDEEQLAYDMFDCLVGVDAREEGFDVILVLYATSIGTRVALRARCPGGREAPTLPSVTGLFRGANWGERETWDMFGIEFEGHPGLEPRLLTVENFEGWPLRKDFPLASRVAKPWPGVKEPAELDEDGNVIEREPRLGDAPGPYELDKAMAEQAKLANPQPEPETASGEAVEDRAEDAEVASDSGAVLAGQDQHHEAERAEEQASDAAVEVSDQAKAEQEHSAAQQVEEREVDGATDPDAAAAAKGTADDARKRQAEARARKAEERRAAAEASSATASGGPTASEPEIGGVASADGGAAERGDDTAPRADERAEPRPDEDAVPRGDTSADGDPAHPEAETDEDRS